MVCPHPRNKIINAKIMEFDDIKMWGALVVVFGIFALLIIYAVGTGFERQMHRKTLCENLCLMHELDMATVASYNHLHGTYRLCVCGNPDNISEVKYIPLNEK